MSLGHILTTRNSGVISKQSSGPGGGRTSFTVHIQKYIIFRLPGNAICVDRKNTSYKREGPSRGQNTHPGLHWMLKPPLLPRPPHFLSPAARGATRPLRRRARRRPSRFLKRPTPTPPPDVPPIRGPFGKFSNSAKVTFDDYVSEISGGDGETRFQSTTTMTTTARIKSIIRIAIPISHIDNKAYNLQHTISSPYRNLLLYYSFHST